MVGRFFSVHLPHPHIQWGLDFLSKKALLLFHLCQSIVPSAPPPHQLCDAWNPSERKILGSVEWHWGKGSRRGGVGGFRVCKSSSPGGCKPLRRVDFLPAGNPAHSLHPPPLTSPADAVRAECTSPESCTAAVWLENRTHLGTLDKMLSAAQFQCFSAVGAQTEQTGEGCCGARTGPWPAARRPTFHIYPPGSRFSHTNQWKQGLGMMQRPGNLHWDGMAPPLLINFYLKDGRGIKLLVTAKKVFFITYLKVAVIQWNYCTVMKIK